MRTVVVAAVVGLISIACAQARSAPSTDPGQVVDAFLAARDARDLDATMASFGESPELRSSRGINWSGRDAVRAIMAYRLQDTYTVGERRVVGDTVTWGEHVRRTIASGSPPANFDEEVEATVVGGHIQSLVTYLGGVRTPPSTAPTSTEVDASEAPLLLPLSIALLVLAVIVWPTTEPRVPRRVPSGELLGGLRRYAELHAAQGREERH